MVDAQRSLDVVDSNAKALLDWLSTFKGFYNKLELQDADAAGRGLFAYGKALNVSQLQLHSETGRLTSARRASAAHSGGEPLEPTDAGQVASEHDPIGTFPGSRVFGLAPALADFRCPEAHDNAAPRPPPRFDP